MLHPLSLDYQSTEYMQGTDEGFKYDKLKFI